jgi:hypothetical protein
MSKERFFERCQRWSAGLPQPLRAVRVAVSKPWYGAVSVVPRIVLVRPLAHDEIYVRVGI